MCICATQIEKNAMYSNLIYLFCHVLEEMIESTLLDLLGVLAIDAALLIAQAQHTF